MTRKRFIPLQAYLCLVAGLVAGGIPALAGAGVWFDDVRARDAISPKAEAGLIRFVTQQVLGRAGEMYPLPKGLETDAGARIIFLSVSDGKSPARVTMARGTGIAAVLADALERERAGRADGHKPAWVRLDIVKEVVGPLKLDWNGPLKHERSLYGVAFARKWGIALLPDVLVARGLVRDNGVLDTRRTSEHLQDKAAKDAFREVCLELKPTLFRFSAISLFSDGRQVVPLYRGHRLMEPLSAERLLACATLAGEYLVRSTGADGRFAYVYDAGRDSVPDKYNILRHAGTTYAMLELYEVTRSEPLRDAATRAIAHLLKHARPGPDDPKGTLCIVEGGEAKLGGNALAIIALARHARVTGDRGQLATMAKLARWIEQAQGDDGRFRIHKQNFPSGKVGRFRSQYYPGEAILALVRLSALDGNGKWLDVAERAAHYLIEVRDKDKPRRELPHDHWLLYGLNELYRARPKARYLDHAMTIAGVIVEAQMRRPKYPDWDWAGGFYQPPRSTPAAVRSEGLCAAYRLARDFGRETEARRFRVAAELATALQLKTQVRPESAMFLTKPQRAMGGFRRGFTSNEIRIDYVQHNISALLALRQIMVSAE